MFCRLVAIFLIFFSGMAHAIAVCTVSPSEADFAVYDETAGSPLDSTSGSVSVTCSDNALVASRLMYYEIRLGPGGGGGFAPRLMANSSFNLNYYLYKSAVYNPANVWGDGSSGSASPLAGCVTVPGGGSPSVPMVHLVHGRIPNGQSPVAVGRYADSVSVTLVLYGDCASGTSAPSSTFASGPLASRADVLAKCAIVTGPHFLEFGDYTRGSGAKTATTTIGVTCPANTSYSIALSGLSGGIRLLTKGSDTLEYNLYSNAGHTVIVGDTPNVDTITGSGTGLRVDTTIYGRLPDSPVNQSAPPGLYQATVNIVVTY